MERGRRCGKRLSLRAQPIGPPLAGGEAERRALPYLFKLRLTANVKRAIERLSGQSDWADSGQGWQEGWKLGPLHRTSRKATVVIAFADGLGFSLSISWPRETEFCGLRPAGDFRRRTRENGRNSVRRPRCASLTDRNYESFCGPGNHLGLPGLHGGGRSRAKPVSADRARLGNREKHTVDGCYCLF